jgi:hypothetical protein
MKHGKSDVPCLYDSKCAHLGELSSLPLHLERMIKNNEVPEKDLFFRRYKSLMIPIEAHINNDALSHIIQYFAANSKLG